MPFFHSDGIDFHFETVGSGPPVVLCHGLTGDLAAPLELVGELPGHQLIVTDARAHGLTQPLGDQSDLTFAQLARDLRGLLDHLEIEQCVVGGISMGAGVAARFAIDCPQRVRGLVLIRPAWLDAPFPPNLELPVLVGRLFCEHGADRWQDFFDRHPLVQIVRASEPTLIETMRNQLDTPIAVQRRARLTRIPGDCPLTDWRELAVLTMPAIVIGSRRDWLHPMEVADTWATRMPKATLLQAAPKPIDSHRHALDVRTHLREFLDSLIKISPIRRK